jgi:hypothetical protein
VSNNAVIQDLSNVRATFLREALAIMVRNHGPDDIVHTLAEVMDDYAIVYARRTGDYDGASSMKLTAAHLAGLELARANHDGAER